LADDNGTKLAFRSDAERKFYESLVHDEGLIAVLRGHLYVEVLLHDVLRARLGSNTDAIIKGLDFFAKYALARRLLLITKQHARELQALGELRNSFAHTFDRMLTVEDDEKMFKAVDDGSKQMIRDYFAKHPDEKVIGGITKLAILMINADISSTAGVLQDLADQGRLVVHVDAVHLNLQIDEE
jgi:hypothetical protein